MPIYGVRTQSICKSKRHKQHVEQVVPAWFTKLCESYRHVCMPHHRLCQVCAEDAVPPGKIDGTVKSLKQTTK